MHNCDNCPGCSGNAGCGGCSGCGGCGRSLTLTEAERDFLLELAQTPFLPIARFPAEETPVFLEKGADRKEEMGILLRMLERKSLIDLDYRTPMNIYAPAYDPYPIKGSLSLTARGQQVLDLLDIQGWNPD